MVLAWTTYSKISMDALGLTTATVLFYCRYMGPLSQNMAPEIMGTSLNIEIDSLDRDRDKDRDRDRDDKRASSQLTLDRPDAE